MVWIRTNIVLRTQIRIRSILILFHNSSFKKIYLMLDITYTFFFTLSNHQSLEHDDQVATAGDLQLWIPDVLEHDCGPDLQRPQPVPRLPLGHHQLWRGGRSWPGPQLAQQLSWPQQTGGRAQSVAAGLLWVALQQVRARVGKSSGHVKWK